MIAGAEALGRVALLRALTPDDLEALDSNMRETHFTAGDVVVREGTRGARILAFFLILDGTATVTVAGAPRASLGPGDCFGEIGLLLDVPRTATVVAETDLLCSAMSAWDFRAFTDEHPDVLATLASSLEARLNP